MRTASLSLVLLTSVALGGCGPRTVESSAPRAVQQERPAAAVSSRGTQIQTARPPSIVQLRGRRVLVYEVAAAVPAGGVPLSIDRIDVLEGSHPLASMDAAAIAASMIVRGADLSPIEPPPRAVTADQAAVVFMLHELPDGAKIADALRVNVSLRYTDGTTEVVGLDVPILPFTPVVLGPPLRGGPWIALNGLSNASLHRRTVPPFATIHAPERYAIDYMLASDAGRVANAPGTTNEDNYAYGKELLAVGDGAIHAALDGLPDNTPGKGPATVTRENIAGNMITLALDRGGYVLYAHIKPGTLTVKRGDRVKKGDVLGLLGNSGNSSAAHFHIHVSDRPDPLESEGVPFVFESFSYVGKIVGGTGDEVVWGPRVNEPQKRTLPAEDEANAF